MAIRNSLLILLLFAGSAFALSTNTVGRTAASPSLNEVAGTYTALGSGAGINVQTDGFDFFWRGLSGNGSIVVRVVDVNGSNILAGIMLRETLEYDARHVSAYAITNATTVQATAKWRDAYSTPAALANTVTSSNIALPRWFKVERAGTSYVVSHSDDGAFWVTNGTAIGMGATNCLYAGIFVANLSGTNATVTFDNLTITGTEPDGATFTNEINGVLAGARYANPARDAGLDEIDTWLSTKKAARPSSGSFLIAGKKFICDNIPSPIYTPTNFIADQANHEARPFDGITMQIGGVTYPTMPMRSRVWDENKILSTYRTLTNYSPIRFTDNFIAFNPLELDWFSDAQWGATLSNSMMLARAAVLGGFAGIRIDGEGAGHPYDYKTLNPGIGCWQYSWADYSAKVRARGSNWIQAVESVCPAPQILFFFLIPQFGEPIATTGWASARVTSTYGLLPDFVSGMLEGSTNSGTRFIDGTEAAYATTTQWFTEAQYTNRHNAFWAALPYYFTAEALSNTNKVQFGVGVMPSRVWNYSLPDAQNKSNWANALTWALRESDRYVWNWHTTTASNIWTSTADADLPYYYVQGISDARTLSLPRYTHTHGSGTLGTSTR